MHEAHLQVDAAAAGRGDDALGGRDAIGHRLLQQDRLARRRRIARERLVRIVGRRNDHRVHVVATHRGGDICRGLRDAEALRERVCTRRRTADDDAYVSPAGRGQAGEVVLGDESGTEHRNADGALVHQPWQPRP